MKKNWHHWLITGGLALSMVGCATPTVQSQLEPSPTAAEVQPTEEPATPEPTEALPTETPAKVDNPAEAAAQQALADSLGITQKEVTVVSSEEVEWSDACLGVSAQGVVCAAVITPGYRVVLEAGGIQYEYHTDLDGRVVKPADIASVDVDEQSQAVQAAIADLAEQAGLDLTDIQLSQAKAVQWPDGCLGVEAPGIVCTQAITPGYQIFLEANGRQYEYHTDLTGGTVQPASIGLEWTRSGGIAGYMDHLILYLPVDGRAAWSSRMSGSEAEKLSDILTSEELEQWNQWLTDYGKVEIGTSDAPGAADAMSVSLTLNGFGTDQPDEATQNAMLSWAQDVFTRLSEKE